MFNLVKGTLYEMDYINYRGEKSRRLIRFMWFEYGDNEWHKTPQFFMVAEDVAKGKTRYFATKDISDLDFFEGLTRK